MAKQTGLGDSLFVGSHDISGDVGSLSALDSTRAIIDVSAIQQTAYDRLLGRADGQIDFAAYFNPARTHPVLDVVGTAAGTAQTIVSYFNKSTFGNPAASIGAAVTTYKLAIGADQSIAVTSSAMASQGHPVEWGVMLTTAVQTFGSAGTSAAYDAGTASAFGAAAYEHVFALTSGTATVAVQHSTTGTSSWSNVTGLAFTAATAATAERVATAGTATLNRYRRINITGTFTGLDVAVNLAAYDSSQT